MRTGHVAGSGLGAVVLAFHMSLSSPGTVVAAVACPDLEAEARTLWAEQRDGGPDPERAETLADLHDAAIGAGCADELRVGLGTLAARAAYLVAGADPGLTLEARRDLLLQARNRGRVWQALALLGDLDTEARDRAAAAQHYQEALDALADERATPTPPNPAVIGAIFAKAEVARLLAEDYVPTTRSAGAPGGLARGEIRGFVPRKVAVPVTFAFDSAAFDAQGEQYAEEMLAYLAEQGEPDIRLIGHTDPRGAEDYNLDLSVRRAEAVASFLKARGYRGTITAEGRGEGDPIVLDDPSAYSEDERHRLARRVELER